MAAVQSVAVRQDFTALQGGLDLVSPAMKIQPGSLIDCLNYEPDINGGYRRMYGIQRFDGRTRPSEASYSIMVCAITGTVSAGDTVVGASSSASAVVLQVNGTTEIVVTKVTGTFVAENIKVSTVVVGSVASIADGAALTPLLDATYLALAANNYRADITTIAGSGEVRGVWHYDGSYYAFRDDAGGTECLMYKATAAGWVQVTFGREIQFTTGVVAIAEGDTITGGTSGASGVVKRVLTRTGTWGSTAAGTLVFDSVTGAFQSGEALKKGATTMATSSSVDTAITLQPGGRFVFRNYAFGGSSTSLRMYFCDGVNYLQEFDGTRLVPIRTGISVDAPKFLDIWKNYMVVSIGSSVEISGVGSPYSWTALTGAAELALGDTCTGIQTQLGNATTGACAIFTKDKTFMLYGTGTSDASLVIHTPNAGAASYTIQNIGEAYYLDTKGVVMLQTTLNFGNFEQATITRKIQPIIDRKRGLAVASCIVRSFNQYRIFFSDGSGIVIYTSGGVPQAITYFDYGKPFNTVESIVDSDGVERIIASGTDGYMYEIDAGTSIDGENIFSYVLMAFNNSQSPRNRKRYRRMVVQAGCLGVAHATVGYDLSYGNPAASQTGAQSSTTMVGGGGWWDQFLWDSFIWDSPYINEYVVDSPGNGDNVGVVIYGETDMDKPYTLHGLITHYMMGRQER